ncbi:MAG: response regulator [Desulfatibacillaceae bacterium]|nr:response regulator [Desulfatibacillaceae bacterium]
MKGKVLVIDDEEDIRVYLSALLEDQGYKARVLQDNESLAGVVRDFGPDCIILDIMMPVRSGVSLYRELKAAPDLKSIPVIILSGMQSAKNFMTDVISHHGEGQAVAEPEGFLEKPLSVPDLMDMIGKLVKTP